MQVHKFGGASLSTVESVRRVAGIVRGLAQEGPCVVVVSAMGKMTNALEAALAAARAAAPELNERIAAIEGFHRSMVAGLLSDPKEARVEMLLADLRVLLEQLPAEPFDAQYDRVIPYGELLSSSIVSAFFAAEGIANRWVDIRGALRTVCQHRDAAVDEALSTPLIRAAFARPDGRLCVTQGFIGSDSTGASTTLGREGSDYTAALLGAIIPAERVSIWKDVEGFMSADPKIFPHARLLSQLGYHDALEITAAGAKVVHPRSIRPLWLARVPLYVRCFDKPAAPGTRIGEIPSGAEEGCLVAVRDSQVLLTATPRGWQGNHVPLLFQILEACHVEVRMLQLAARSLSIAVDDDAERLPRLLEALAPNFTTTYNRGQVLVSLRHPSPHLQGRIAGVGGITLLQRTRATLQVLLAAERWEEELLPSLREWLAE